jgi:hypothetical protein
VPSAPVGCGCRWVGEGFVAGRWRELRGGRWRGGSTHACVGASAAAAARPRLVTAPGLPCSATTRGEGRSRGTARPARWQRGWREVSRVCCAMCQVLARPPHTQPAGRCMHTWQCGWDLGMHVGAQTLPTKPYFIGIHVGAQTLLTKPYFIRMEHTHTHTHTHTC